MSKNTGGPAFPEQQGTDAHGEKYSIGEGMTLLDYFAAHCPITWDQAQDYNMSDEDALAFFCKVRFEYAEKMLAERAK